MKQILFPLIERVQTNLPLNNHRPSDTSSSVHRNPQLIHEPTPPHEEMPFHTTSCISSLLTLPRVEKTTEKKPVVHLW